MTTLKQYEINRYSRILGYGAARGEVIVPNDDIVEAIDSSDEWIKQRTGIATRHRASENQSVADLAIGAAKDALEASGVAGEDIEAVIVLCFLNIHTMNTLFLHKFFGFYRIAIPPLPRIGTQKHPKRFLQICKKCPPG